MTTTNATEGATMSEETMAETMTRRDGAPLRRADLVHIRGRREAGDHLYAVEAVDTDDFTGVQRVRAHPLLPRLFVGRDAPPRPQASLLPEELTRLPSPAEALAGALPLRREAWPTRTRQAIERLYALWLLHEDRKRLLDVAPVDQLAHQVSLLEYVRENDLRRILIADEVGLGKTIEAGLLIRWVLETDPGARVLYLTPAMLVDNVYRELRRMKVPARVDRYAALDGSLGHDHLRDAQVVVASIHRAAFERNLDRWRDASGAWDLLIVDECHHASDWSEDGSSPKRQMRLVRDLVERNLAPGGRLVLMSATPHQGHEHKFRNLLRLLADEGYRAADGSLESVAGRVIYRTKEDVRDWDGEPLFSKRRVHAPTYVELGRDYLDWLDAVARVFADADAGPAAWRKAQALQWSASSPKAGLAYLARLALRGGFDLELEPILWEVAAALRPYRGLPADAAPAAVRALLERQSARGRRGDGDEGDEDDADLAEVAPVDRAALEAALRGGLELVRSRAMETKLAPLLGWVEAEAPAKFVVFASPIETVDEIRLGLEGVLGEDAVVTITGAQRPGERMARMQAFRGERVRVLVASRAGSEGINLQVAHRLVHFDVPWNPMEMEQRVGRVHRYGSTRTVVVDTIVVQGSREERMLSRCRARLAQIVEQLFGPQARDGSRFEEMYSRVMSQVSAEELAELMATEGFLTSSDERLDELVQAGFEGWRASDEALRRSRVEATAGIPERGCTRDEDLAGIFELLGAEREAGWRHVRLVERGGERVEVDALADVWVFPAEGAGVRRVADRRASLTVRGPEGFEGFVARAGLNLPAVAAKLRELVGGGDPAMGRSPRATGFVDGAGAVRLPEPDWDAWLATAGASESLGRGGAVVLAWAVRLLHRGTATEAWTGLRLHLAARDLARGMWLDDRAAAGLLRLLWRDRRRQNLVVPPHRRADAAGFDLGRLPERAAQLTPEAARRAEGFDPRRHDVELVPIGAFTVEARGEVDGDELVPEPSDASFDRIGATHRPPPDLLERVLATLDALRPADAPGDRALCVAVAVEPARLAQAGDGEGAEAFGVSVGVARADAVREAAFDALARAVAPQQPGAELVGFVRLASRHTGLSPSAAAALHQDAVSALRRAGVRILGAGHGPPPRSTAET